MASYPCRMLAIILFTFSSISVAIAQKKKPLTEAELLSLVAGNALPENIAQEIHTRGLSFHPDNSYRSSLTDAGANSLILAALNKARPASLSADATKTSPELLHHLAAAGKFMRAKQFQNAARELADAAQASEGAEPAFVMGELLRQQEEWPLAVSVYEEVLERRPDFPEARTKLSYVLFKTGDCEESLREAQTALAQSPKNAEAHKNAGLALLTARKFEASAAEFQEALRIKPDYQPLRFDLGLLLSDKGDLDASIVEYRKALALDPNDADAHEYLALAIQQKGDIDSAIRELREAKRIDPENFEIRHNLGAALMAGNYNAEAVAEFRELEVFAPDFVVCHLCLGSALQATGDLEGAAKEFLMASRLHPSDPRGLAYLGNIHFFQKNLDAALEDYRAALRVDENCQDAHLGLGRILNSLTGQAQVLRNLGHNDEAVKLENRIKSIQASASH